MSFDRPLHFLNDFLHLKIGSDLNSRASWIHPSPFLLSFTAQIFYFGIQFWAYLDLIWPMVVEFSLEGARFACVRDVAKCSSIHSNHLHLIGWHLKEHRKFVHQLTMNLLFANILHFLVVLYQELFDNFAPYRRCLWCRPGFIFADSGLLQHSFESLWHLNFLNRFCCVMS